MIHKTVDGVLLRDMIISGAACLEKNKQHIDALNVFPVPDGDTGTNMTLTMMSAVKEIKDMQSNHAGEVALAAARGALKGARGNSGVILSQLFRGFARGMENHQQLNANDFASALACGSDMAYKAVMKPKEGTILTVARSISQAAMEQSNNVMPILDLIEIMLSSGEDMLKKTPDMLPVLKQAGVVDAGGKGLLCIYYGYKMALNGESDYVITTTDTVTVNNQSYEIENDTHIMPLEDIVYPYCTELFIKYLKPDTDTRTIERLRDELSRIGDSLVVVGDEELIKIHVHTKSPGQVLQYALEHGELDDVKIENMLEQNREIVAKQQAQQKDIAMVSVVSGEGIANIFKDLMIDVIVEGGQSMNPSIDDIAKAINKAPSQNVFIFPNNSNIILAAQQAKEVVNKNVCVIPTKSIPQGISSSLAFHMDLSFEENKNRMEQAVSQVKTGQITHAVRDSSIDGIQVKQGDVIGLLDGKIVTSGVGVHQTALDLLKIMISPDNEIITILYGQDVDEVNAEQFSKQVEEIFDQCDVESHWGGQPLYDYIFSVS